MIIDAFGQFCDAEPIPTSGTSVFAFGDSIPASVVRDQGQGSPVYLVIRTGTAGASGSATIQFRLASDDTEDGESGATIHWQSPQLNVDGTDMPANTVLFVVPLPLEGTQTYEEYLLLSPFMGSATTVTAGTIDAFLVKDASQWKAYADATN